MGEFKALFLTLLIAASAIGAPQKSEEISESKPEEIPISISDVINNGGQIKPKVSPESTQKEVAVTLGPAPIAPKESGQISESTSDEKKKEEKTENDKIENAALPTTTAAPQEENVEKTEEQPTTEESGFWQGVFASFEKFIESVQTLFTPTSKVNTATTPVPDFPKDNNVEPTEKDNSGSTATP